MRSKYNGESTFRFLIKKILLGIALQLRLYVSREAQDSEADLTALEAHHGGYGALAEECDGLRDRMRRMRLNDKKQDKGVYGRMFGIGST